MWIFSKDGFVSVVEHRDDKELLLIRGRIKDDIEDIANLAEVLTGEKPEIVEMPDADYRFRIFLSKHVFKEIMQVKIDDLDYPNFKSSIRDHDRHNAYLDIWSVMHGFATRKKRTENYTSIR